MRTLCRPRSPHLLAFLHHLCLGLSSTPSPPVCSAVHTPFFVGVLCSRGLSMFAICLFMWFCCLLFFSNVVRRRLSAAMISAGDERRLRAPKDRLLMWFTVEAKVVAVTKAHSGVRRILFIRRAPRCVWCRFFPQFAHTKLSAAS